MSCSWVSSPWKIFPLNPMQRLRLTKNKTTCKLISSNFWAVMVRRRSKWNNLISVTFVEVQLGSGGVLCVAQGTAQSHGKEGED